MEKTFPVYINKFKIGMPKRYNLKIYQYSTFKDEYFGIDPISGAPVNIESYDISMAIGREGGKAEIFLTPGDGLTLTNNKLKILLTPEQTKLIPGSSISDVRFKKDGLTFFGLFFEIECNPAVTR